MTNSNSKDDGVLQFMLILGNLKVMWIRFWKILESGHVFGNFLFRTINGLDGFSGTLMGPSLLQITCTGWPFLQCFWMKRVWKMVLRRIICRPWTELGKFWRWNVFWAWRQHDRSLHWLIDWLIDCLIDCLIDRSIDWLIDWLILVYFLYRCVKVALVHDMCEAIVGDITPHCGVSVEEKHRREKVRFIIRQFADPARGQMSMLPLT